MISDKRPTQEKLQLPDATCPGERTPSGDIVALAHSISEQFELPIGRPELVQEYCEALSKQLAGFEKPEACEALGLLASLPSRRAGPIAFPVFSLLEEVTALTENPWPLLRGMLTSRDPNLARRGLDVVYRLVTSRPLSVGLKEALLFARCVESEGSPFADPTQLRKIARILSRLDMEESGHNQPLLHLYCSRQDFGLRQLAARVLDLEEQPVPSELCERLLGSEEFSFLLPYLSFTRAGYRDLLSLIAEPSSLSALVNSLRLAEAICGESLLKEVIAKLGWSRLNLGLEARKYAGFSVEGSYPIFALPAEASFLAGCGGVQRLSEYYLFVAHGGMPTQGTSLGEQGDSIGRFRSYNVTHSEVLADIMNLAPLTRPRVDRILVRMDKIVSDFMALFSSHTSESAILPSIYEDLKHKIISELEKEPSEPQLSADLTRLVQAFEDPRSLGVVRTLHGLKRYLHQRGLKFGMELVKSGRGTNRTIDLALVSRPDSFLPIRRIRYVDFGPSSSTRETAVTIPHPVGLLVEGFGRQLLAGQGKFPEAKVFCYGNEVHYYLSYGNHPAFLRVDYSPPLQGGMIDLEYFGVSKYEMSLHPDRSLEASRRFFRDFEFDVRVEQTRIHARYDKERALDLASICEKAEILFRFVPFLMDLDWVIGNLDLKPEAKEKVATAWASFMRLWGSLPMARFLTADRKGILSAIEPGPMANREIPWSGEGPYHDRAGVPLPQGFLATVRTSLRQKGLSEEWLPREVVHAPIGQIGLERELLRPLRQALTQGELIPAPGGMRSQSTQLFQRTHEGLVFAEILRSPAETLHSSFQVAQLVTPLERTLPFRTTGHINGHEIQQAALSLLDKTLGIYLLRDPDGIIRFAFYAPGGVLYRHRGRLSDSWQKNWSCDPAVLLKMLRDNNYLSAEAELVLTTGSDQVAETRDKFDHDSPMRRPTPLPGERLLMGIKASPGRIVGSLLFGTSGRLPSDFEDKILVASAIRPEDSVFLCSCSGIISTSGGILSHAGLLAMQYRKASLLVAGNWILGGQGQPALSFRALEYRQEVQQFLGYRVALYRDIHEREYRLYEGDLAVLDADEGFVRVLGQDCDTLALDAAFKVFSRTSRELQGLHDAKGILIRRGQRLQAGHKIEKLLSRISDAVLARHAAHELLLGKELAWSVGGSERAHYLALILSNVHVAGTCRQYLRQVAEDLRRRFRATFERAEGQIPASASVYHVLSLRLDALMLLQSSKSIVSVLRSCGIESDPPVESAQAKINELAKRRLTVLRRHMYATINRTAGGPGSRYRLRHLLNEVRKLDRVLGGERRCQSKAHEWVKLLGAEDESARKKHRPQRICISKNCGIELHPLIGWKAANLGEVERLGGSHMVPSWFAVTNHAFEETMQSPLGKLSEDLRKLLPAASSLQEGIEAILTRKDLDYTQQSACIRQLWEGVELEPDLVKELATAYQCLSASAQDDEAGFVAVRSSAREEDTATAARAGEFETFLFVRGEQALLKYLRRAWAGLWTDRAIHNRSILGCGHRNIGGGVIIQHALRARVAGVLQTSNGVDCDCSQMIVNVGLGLGEGVVSGTVGADLIVISKDRELQKGLPRFRYVISDKKEQSVFNREAGIGIRREETPYHQRLRPALEYVELCELACTALMLESAYGYPLDIEFAIEESKLWILQARPIATFISSIGKTIRDYPLVCRKKRDIH